MSELQKILPTNAKQFETEKYWDSFFTERNGSVFEWYCETEDLAPILQQQGCHSQQWVLTVGCGNSLLPLDLCDSHGYAISINIDFNAQVVCEMARRNENNNRPGVGFGVMDALNLGLRENAIDLVIDKGLMDAMLSDDSEYSRQRCLQIFEEELRVLRPTGLIVIVSLCQSHILALLEHCQPLLASRCDWAKLYPIAPKKANSPLMPFCICLKKSSSSSPMCDISLSLSRENSNEVKSVEKFTEIVQDIEKLQADYAQEYSRRQSEQDRGTLLTLDLKPWDSDVDLQQVKQELFMMDLEKVRWLTEDAEILPVGFGIHKLRQKCLVAEEYDLMELCDVLCEKLEAHIQSVDIVSNYQANVIR